MCGIIGFIGYAREGQWRQTHDLLRALYFASEHRGQDATGFVAQTDPLDHPFIQKTVLVQKEPMNASHFVESNSAFRRLRHQRCSVFIGHVRAATHGSPDTGDNRNNHPHVSGGLYLVHNGIVTNHRELADEYALRLATECDSECLVHLVATEEHRALGLDLCLRKAQGSMAIAMFDSLSGLVWLARNSGRPLWLARLERDRRWFFASTGTILLEAFRRVLGKNSVRFDYFAPIPTDAPLALSPTGMIIAPLMGPA